MRNTAFLVLVAIGALGASIIACSHTKDEDSLTSAAEIGTGSDLVISQIFTGGGDPGPCDSESFTYDANGRQLDSVHLAGTFNEWLERTEPTSPWRLKSEGDGGLFALT